MNREIIKRKQEGKKTKNGQKTRGGKRIVLISHQLWSVLQEEILWTFSWWMKSAVSDIHRIHGLSSMFGLFFDHAYLLVVPANWLLVSSSLSCTIFLNLCISSSYWPLSMSEEPWIELNPGLTPSLSSESERFPSKARTICLSDQCHREHEILTKKQYQKGQHRHKNLSKAGCFWSEFGKRYQNYWRA